jgi:hypothetical protein
MSDESLQAIVEEIGVLADRAEASKWGLAEAVATAYAEFEAYHRGLTSGLCIRLKRSTDMIYALRDAANLRESLRYESDLLTVSHFSTLSHLRDRYELSDDDCRSWLEWAQENCISVREMAIEVSLQRETDARKAFFKRIEKINKLVQLAWQDCESVGLPDNLRAATKIVLSALREWVEKLLAWGN